MRTLSRECRVLVATLALVAGSTASALAADAVSKINVRRSPVGAQLSLGKGAAFHTADGTVSNTRVFGVPGTPTVLATWDQRSGAGVTHWYAISLTGNGFDAVRQTDYTIRLRYASFDPLTQGEPAMPEALQSPQTNVYIVQFWTMPLESMREAIAALGGSVVQYMPEQSHIVRMSPEAAAQVAALPYVRWVGKNHAAYKLEEPVLAMLNADGPANAGSVYTIMALDRGPADQNALGAFIQQLGGQVRGTNPYAYNMQVVLSPEQLRQVMQRDEAYFIETWGPGGTDMDIARQIGGAHNYLSGLGFKGQGVRGEVFDTEVSAAHPQWNGQAPLYHGANGNAGTHGSSCYGINFATGNGNAQATGMCPEREQGIFAFYANWSPFGGQPRHLLTQQSVDPAQPYKSSYQTSSVGSPQITTYSAVSAETDDYLFLYDYLSCQSQSNTGNQTSRPQAWAKNIVSVGALDHMDTLSRADDNQSGASFGPASDGRIKPDLLHFYDSIFTTTAGSGYTQFGGTSGATPITAGHFGLLFQMVHQGVIPGLDPGSTVFASRPKMVTAKALMMNNAYQYNWLAGGAGAGLTRARQGWGMADVRRIYDMRNKTVVHNEDYALAPLETKTYNIVVSAGEPELRITMAYVDPQGNPANQSQHRVNDLTLRVVSPADAVYYGNSGATAGLYTTAGGVANVKDTVEMVYVQNPTPGTWTVEVRGDAIIQDSRPETPGLNADYALVVTGGLEAGGCYPDCDGNGTLNVQDYVCFQTRFATSAPYADCDGNGQFNVQDYVCFQTKFALGC